MYFIIPITVNKPPIKKRAPSTAIRILIKFERSNSPDSTLLIKNIATVIPEATNPRLLKNTPLQNSIILFLRLKAIFASV